MHLNSLFNSFSYRLGKFLIDPGDEWEGFENVEAVLLTHAHFDHIYGLNRVVELNPFLIVYTNESGKKMLLNSRKNLSFYHDSPFVFNYPKNICIVNDSDEIIIEGKKAKAVFSPGHNPSCISWIIENNLFTGDAYISGLKTITNLPKGNKRQAEESKSLILSLSESILNCKIYPGHPCVNK